MHQFQKTLLQRANMLLPLLVDQRELEELAGQRGVAIQRHAHGGARVDSHLARKREQGLALFGRQRARQQRHAMSERIPDLIQRHLLNEAPIGVHAITTSFLNQGLAKGFGLHGGSSVEARRSKPTLRRRPIDSRDGNARSIAPRGYDATQQPVMPDMLQTQARQNAAASEASTSKCRASTEPPTANARLALA